MRRVVCVGGDVTSVFSWGRHTADTGPFCSCPSPALWCSQKLAIQLGLSRPLPAAVQLELLPTKAAWGEVEKGFQPSEHIVGCPGNQTESNPVVI